ncbi:MAG: rod shape-determining protein MreD [Spirochaetes bacterium]|nr:rod shape-determining protein MreD [Spirochaetota bacterium]
MIYTYVFSGVLLGLSLLIQSHPSFDVLRIAGVKPDLLFIVIVYLAYTYGSFYGEIVGFISGLLQDSISNSLLGLLTFPKMAIGLVVGMFGRSVIKDNILSVTLMLFVASLAKNIVTLMLYYIFHQASASAVIGVILPESFYNAILAPPLFFLFDKIFQKDLKREGYL